MVDPHKIVLYRPGDFFAEHEDSSHGYRDVVATIVVELPMEYAATTAPAGGLEVRGPDGALAAVFDPIASANAADGVSDVSPSNQRASPLHWVPRLSVEPSDRDGPTHECSRLMAHSSRSAPFFSSSWALSSLPADPTSRSSQTRCAC
jgi:hypothetical protein